MNSSSLSSKADTETTTIVYGEEKVIGQALQFASRARTEISACLDRSRPLLLAREIPSLRKAFMDSKKRGVRLDYITEITNENVSYCKMLMGIITELRHLDGIKGNFYISDTEYIAPATSREEGRAAASQLIYSNVKEIVEHQRYVFDTLWGKAIPAGQRIKEIEEGPAAADRIRNIENGVDSTNIEIIENPRESLKLAENMVKSAREEVLRIYPSINAFRRQVKIGAMKLFWEIVNHNVRVRIIIPSDEKELKQIVDEVSLVLPQLDIRSIDKTLETHIGIIVVDRRESLIVESKNDARDNYYEAAGLAAYSNSRYIALSYASIFESLWKQTEMYEQSRAFNRMQKEFINVAAHELRTPVQPIIGLTGDLYSRVQDRQLKEKLEVIFRNAKRLHRLVEDILDVTRIESNSLNIRRERFNLKEVVLNVINDIKNSKEFQYSRKNVKIVFDTTKQLYDDDNISIDADKERIYQVISNLVGNAIKFTEKGVIRVIIGVEKEKDEGRRIRNGNGKRVIVLVRDTGIGIHSEMFSRLFTKFASKSFEGTGLGLFISKNIIETHGGKIWAKNNDDDDDNAKGATFGFSLPLV